MVLYHKTSLYLAEVLWDMSDKPFVPILSNSSRYLEVEIDFFSSGIQLYVLLTPYLCFISFLYLDLFVLGDIHRSAMDL